MKGALTWELLDVTRGQNCRVEETCVLERPLANGGTPEIKQQMWMQPFLDIALQCFRFI